MITDKLWKERFSADRGAIGRHIRLNGEPCEIVGVLPPGAKLEDADIIAPEPNQRLPRSARFLTQVGRLKPGALMETAQREAETVAARLRAEYPATDAGLGVQILSLRSEVAATFSTPLLVLLGAVTLLLLMACINVASLFLSRIAARQHELSICRALGATRAGLVRLVLVETAIVAAIGGMLGLLASAWAIDLLRSIAPRQMPRIEEVHMDWHVVAFAAACTLVAATISSLVPALQVSGKDVNYGLKNGARGTADHRRSQSFLVAGQMGLSIMLLVSSGLLFRSLWNLQHRPLGFQPAGLATFHLSLPWQTPDAQVNALYGRVLDRVRAVPGVREAALVDRLPLGGDTQDGEVEVAGKDANAIPAGSTINKRSVSANYHRLMRIPLINGRYLEEADARYKRAVINQAAARAYFPGENPVGHRVGVRWRNDSNPNKDLFEIVGVVADTPSRVRESRSEPAFYIPYQQSFWPLAAFVLRTAGPPAAMAGAVRRAVAEVDSTHALDSVAGFDTWLASRSETERLQAWLVETFTLAALLLAAVGVYGLAARRLAGQQKEIAIRIALGAQSGKITREMLLAVLRPASAGAVAGIPIAAALARSFRSVLFGVQAFDAWTYAIAALALILLAIAAAWRPARRAASLDPMRVLRAE